MKFTNSCSLLRVYTKYVCYIYTPPPNRKTFERNNSVLLHDKDSHITFIPVLRDMKFTIWKMFLCLSSHNTQFGCNLKFYNMDNDDPRSRAPD